MGRLPDRGVVHVQVAADGADHDLAGVEPDANLHDHALRAPHGLGVTADGLLHAERGIAAPHRVILVRDGRAEQGHDPVAHDLVHRALVAVHGLHHGLEHGVEESADLLGIAIGQQLERPLDVGEQHRHLLALALEGRPRCQDALGEMLRRVRRGGASGIVGRRRGQALAALHAKTGAVRRLGAADGAAGGEAGAAVRTEARVRRVDLPAPGTPHRDGPAATSTSPRSSFTEGGLSRKRVAGDVLAEA